jgi:hypothetical protein
VQSLLPVKYHPSAHSQAEESVLAMFRVVMAPLHCLQLGIPSSGPNRPRSQNVQSACPSKEYFPEGHLEQVKVPSVEANVPNEQGKQAP